MCRIEVVVQHYSYRVTKPSLALESKICYDFKFFTSIDCHFTCYMSVWWGWCGTAITVNASNEKILTCKLLCNTLLDMQQQIFENAPIWHSVTTNSFLMYKLVWYQTLFNWTDCGCYKSYFIHLKLIYKEYTTG